MDTRHVYRWDGEDCCTLPFQFRGVSFPLFLLNLHFVAVIFSWFNWRYFISYEVSLIGKSQINLYLAFVIIGTVGFFLIASLFMYAAYRWASFLREKSRRNRLMSGLAICYLFYLLPLWMIEFGIVQEYGWQALLQSLHFAFITILWVVETIAVWLAYAWHAAGFLHDRYAGTGVFGDNQN